MHLLLYTLVAVIAFWLSMKYPWWRPGVSRFRPRILMYHMVKAPVDGARFNGLRVRPADFERQIAWLQKSGWQFWFLSELWEAASPPEGVAVITFDDGYEDNYSNALPILQKYDAKATLFLVEDRFDNDWSTKKKAHHSGGELMREPKLSDQQVREMLASGCFELGAHSVTHPDFSKLTLEEKRFEIAESKRRLEARFHARIESYAYTFGIYDLEDIALVEEYGYQCAVTTEEGINRDFQSQRFELSRVKVSGKKNMLHFRLALRVGWRAFG